MPEYVPSAGFSTRCHRRRSVAWAIAALMCAAVAQAGCKPRPRVVSVSRIIIDAPREFDDKPKEREELRRRVRERLKSDSSVSLARRRADATHVLHLVIGSASTLAAVPPDDAVVVQVTLRPTDDAPAYSAESKTGGRTDTNALESAFVDAWETVFRQRRLEAGGVEPLIGALQDPDVLVRAFAIRRLGELRAIDSVDPLCDVLRTEQEQRLVLRTIGSLVAIGDVRAVKPLIEITRRKDPGFVLQVVFAVGSIGGRTAEAFLVTLAEGHSEAEVRRGAKDALDELARRGRPRPAAPGAPAAGR